MTLQLIQVPSDTGSTWIDPHEVIAVRPMKTAEGWAIIFSMRPNGVDRGPAIVVLADGEEYAKNIIAEFMRRAHRLEES